ncbi:hypothetical protein [Thermococcus sp. 21S7]|uniref:hypothetical protein n=1 Tax=Thermococcus sp. 21S7 TaxID=1638221 RepID=UPI00143B34F3|nr:hypothetical protein [Thermococcus sp. 21S7]NJE60764.1 hypothetical protein [Thermococcus sp. 21S7]
MPYIGFAKSPYGPAKTYEVLMRELEKLGFRVFFSKHHWMGDAPFGLIVAETDKGNVAIRWNLSGEVDLRLEKVEGGDFEEFVEDTMEYLTGD